MVVPVIHKAAASDSSWGGEMILSTLYGFGIYQTGLGDHERASKALAQYFRMPANRFSFQVSWVAEVEGKNAGLLVVFPGSQFARLNFQTALKTPKVYRPHEIIEFVKRMLILRDEEEVSNDEFYVAHLAVAPQFQRRGVGRALLAESEKQAAMAGFNKLSLMAEYENRNAIALYEKTGFETVKSFDHPHQTQHTGSRGYIKMTKMI